MSTNITTDELIRRALDSRVGDVWTSFPARVKSYDAANQAAELEPMIRRPVPSEEGAWTSEELPILPAVKVVFPRGGGGTVAITWPLEAGDCVLVHVTIYSFAAWLRTGQVSDPGDLRAHHLSNAFAVPGVAPNDKALNQATDSALVIEAGTIKIGKDAAAFIAKADKVMANFNALVTTLGSGTAGGDPVTFSTPFSPEDVAASKGKVE